MSRLNCRAGDLAVVVDSLGKESVGKIVKVLQFYGNIPMFGFTGLVPTWKIEIATPGDLLVYLEPDNDEGCCTGNTIYRKSGVCPDAYLRRITPPKEESSDDISNCKPLILEEELCDA